MEAIGAVMNAIAVAFNALQSMGMVIAIAIVAALLSSLGGLVDVRMRLYGAIVGGMIMNLVVKAEGGSYAAALAAATLIAGLAFGLASLPFLAALLRRVRQVRR